MNDAPLKLVSVKMFIKACIDKFAVSERSLELNYTETIVTMAGLSKFVVADLSGKSVPQELLAISINFKKPIIAFSKRKSSSMFKDIKNKNENVIDFKIASDSDILRNIEMTLPIIENITKQTILTLAKE